MSDESPIAPLIVEFDVAALGDAGRERRDRTVHGRGHVIDQEGSAPVEASNANRPGDAAAGSAHP